MHPVCTSLLLMVVNYCKYKFTSKYQTKQKKLALPIYVSATVKNADGNQKWIYAMLIASIAELMLIVW